MYNVTMLVVKDIKQTGFLYNSKIKVGDKITAFNSNAVVDVLDYLYYDSFEEFSITAIRDGNEFSVEVIKPETASMGLIFESDGLELQTCRNKLQHRK